MAKIRNRQLYVRVDFDTRVRHQPQIIYRKCFPSSDQPTKLIKIVIMRKWIE